jgi:hypothetical protein
VHSNIHIKSESEAVEVSFSGDPERDQQSSQLDNFFSAMTLGGYFKVEMQ